MTPTAPNSPKIVQFRQLRTAIALFLAAGAIAGYYFYTRSATNDDSVVDTKEQILALQVGADSSHAVLIKPDGTIIRAPGDEDGIDDREAVWRPDGNRVFISRAAAKSTAPDETNYQIYRWNPGNGQIQRRTIGTRALAHPRFSSADAANPNALALATAGGRVLVFDPLQDSSIHQVLPPVASKNSTVNAAEPDEEGSADLGMAYKGIGTSFREARWSSDKTYIVAVMRRDTGEALIVQKAEPTSDDERRPQLIVCADHIDFDVSSAINTVAFTALNFQWPDPTHVPDQFKKAGKVTRPYNHMLGLIDLNKFASQDPTSVSVRDISKTDDKAFGEPRFSPDGIAILVVAGAYKGNSEFNSSGLMAYATQGGQPKSVAAGAISNPAWHPSGTKFVFVRRGTDGTHTIILFEGNGQPERSLAAGKGDFTHPEFSPQL